MKRFVSFLLLTLFAFAAFAQPFTLESPDGSIKLVLSSGTGSVSWTLFVDDRQVLKADNIRLNARVYDGHYTARQVCRYYGDKYNGLRLRLNKTLLLDLRLFNNGFAYRWIGDTAGTVEIVSESLDLLPGPDDTLFFPREKSLISHYERSYIRTGFGNLPDSAFASLPVLLKANGIDVLITDADLYDYPNMFLQKSNSVLKAIYPAYVLETKPDPRRADRNQIITREAGYIAKTQGRRTYPWRVFAIAREDKDLLANNLVFDLSRTNPYDWDFSWVKPGKVAWDWWNALQLKGVDFKPGINTRTYKFYIDFAAEYGLQYVILDEGWSLTTWDLLHFKPGIDVKELIRYGKQKNVGVILWVLWNPLNQNMEQVLDSFAAWGAAGIKVDFMQRGDQAMVNFYERTAREAAKRHLIVDFHGAYKPSGLRRAYPNVLSYEGVKGAEHNKWSKDITPEHNTTLPFIRNVVGPMDYTPGGMRNATAQSFKIDWNFPQVMSTRAQQVAMYVVFYSPLQMLADSPTEYMANDRTTRFIARIPTVWDETVPLAGKTGRYVALARRYGTQWYIGIMNGETSRSLQVKLDFLPDGKKYKLEYFADSQESATHPEKYVTGVMTVDKNTVLNVVMPWGGGYAAILTPVN